MHDGEDILYLYHVRQNRKAYTREENDLGDDSSMSIPDDRNFCDTISTDNIDLGINDIK